jgi:hypothetical protein
MSAVFDASICISTKSVHGFKPGDMVRAEVPKGGRSPWAKAGRSRSFGRTDFNGRLPPTVAIGRLMQFVRIEVHATGPNNIKSAS